MARPDEVLIANYYRGDFGVARERVKQRLAERSGLERGATADDPDRDYVLDRMRLGLTTLADGYASEHWTAWDQVYETLRQASLNKSRQVAAVVLNEDQKIWKGEPFEQALAFHYVGLHYASMGSWDNARAGFLNALFPLNEIVEPAEGDVVGPREAIEAAAREDERDLFESPVEVRTNFTLGYLMLGLAATQLEAERGGPGHADEARENFNQALALRPDLAPLVDRLADPTRYNTVLVVDFGRGPQKIATGPDNAIAAFRPITPSTPDALAVTVNGQTRRMPAVCDVNRMALDHRWNDLEEMRKAKSLIGQLLMTAGILTIGFGDSDETLWAGLGMIGAGLFARAGAHADTRYCELMPQRVYIVPLTVHEPNATVRLQVDRAPESRLVLTGLTPPPGPSAQLRYVRLVSDPRGGYGTLTDPPAWATSGRVRYANEHQPSAGELALPYILGGDDVRRPSEAALADYRRAGFLPDYSVADLVQLYQAEGIVTDPANEGGVPGRHVLERGRSLQTPLPGTTGYARLFGVRRGPYHPRSAAVRQAVEQLEGRR